MGCLSSDDPLKYQNTEISRRNDLQHKKLMFPILNEHEGTEGGRGRFPPQHRSSISCHMHPKFIKTLKQNHCNITKSQHARGTLTGSSFFLDESVTGSTPPLPRSRIHGHGAPAVAPSAVGGLVEAQGEEEARLPWLPPRSSSSSAAWPSSTMAAAQSSFATSRPSPVMHGVQNSSTERLPPRSSS